MKFVKVQDKIVFPTAHADYLQQVIPGLEKLQALVGGHIVAAPHSDDIVKLLRNTGHPAPACITTDYKWSGLFTPREVQRVTAEFFTLHNRAFCLNDMGTGKTISSLWAYDYLRSQGRVNKVLITCPLSTMNMTWAREVFTHFPHLKAIVLYGSRDVRKQLLKEDADIYIINHDGARIIADDLMSRPDIDLIILDELSVYKNASSQRWKVMNTIANKQCNGTRKVWGMTGTPTPNAPIDAFAQVKLVNPKMLEREQVQTMTKFKYRTMTQLTSFKWAAKPDAETFVHRVMAPSVRFTLDDCVELPEQVVIEQAPELSKKQAKAYKDMRDKMHVQMDTEEVTAVNAAVLVNKLLQVSCGAVYANEEDEGQKTRRVMDLDPAPRLEALVEAIKESEGKVLVFVPFGNATEQVNKKLDKEHIGYVTITGSVNGGKRRELLDRFKTDPDVKVLVAQPATMSHGLTLTEATTIIWYGLITSYETFEQANARVRRPGQTKKTAIVIFATTPAEKRVLRLLRDKGESQDKLLDLLREL